MTLDLFLSYAQEDTSKATELVRLLEDEGWSVWWDREVIAGRDFELEIDQALTACKAVVVLWSKFSVNSTWVRNEAKEAKDNNKLIPVLLDDARVPLSFRSLSTLELNGWPDTSSTIDIASLKSAVRRVLADEHLLQTLDRSNRPNDLTLSVRVATRVADMVGQKQTTQSELAALRMKLSIEHCITDFVLGFGSIPSSDRTRRLDQFIAELGGYLNAKVIACSLIQLDSLSVSLEPITGKKELTPPIEESIRRHIKEFIVPDDNGVTFSMEHWKDNEFLLLPLPYDGRERKYIWFLINQSELGWDLILQERMLDVSRFLSEKFTAGVQDA